MFRYTSFACSNEAKTYLQQVPKKSTFNPSLADACSSTGMRCSKAENMDTSSGARNVWVVIRKIILQRDAI